LLTEFCTSVALLLEGVQCSIEEGLVALVIKTCTFLLLLPEEGEPSMKKL